MKSIASLAIEDRPREKLLKRGAAVLEDYELLAVALGSGSRDKDVLTLARELLPVFDQRNGSLRAEHLAEVRGLGEAKAAALTAMIEFARRRIRPEGVKIRTAADIIPLIQHIAERKQEHFICISLNGAHEVIATRTVTVGLVNAAHVHPREVFSDPITDRACAIIVAHNHPSGDLTPSAEDIDVTKRLDKAGTTLGIRLLDHVVFSRRGYFSLREAGHV